MVAACAEVEFNKSFLVRPTLLLKYDNIWIDQSDYEEIMLRSSESAWQKMISDNLVFLENEGFIKKNNFREALSTQEKAFIKEKGETLTNLLTHDQKQRFLIHAWEDFIKYITVKLSYINPDTNLHTKEFYFREKCGAKLHAINSGDWDMEEQSFILRQCFWKAYASVLISKKLGECHLHMANEYKPFISRIYDDSNYFESTRIQKVDQLVEYAYTLALPQVSIDSFHQKKAFLILRKKSINEYRLLCEQIEELLEKAEESGVGMDAVQKLMKLQWENGIEELKSRNIAYRALVNASLFSINLAMMAYGSVMTPEVSNNYKNIAKKPLSKPLAKLKYSKIEWQAAFCSLFNENELQRLSNEINKSARNSTLKVSYSDYWLDNLDKTPWYVK